MLKLLQALEPLDGAVIWFFTEIGRLAVDGGGLGDVALSKHSGVGLDEVLRPLDLGIPLVDHFAQSATDHVDRGTTVVSGAIEIVSVYLVESLGWHGQVRHTTGDGALFENGLIHDLRLPQYLEAIDLGRQGLLQKIIYVPVGLKGVVCKG